MQADFLHFRTNKERKNAKRKKQKNGVDSKQNKNESGYSLNLNLDSEAQIRSLISFTHKKFNCQNHFLCPK